MDDQTNTVLTNSAPLEKRRPPMPEFLFKLINPVMKAILRSPLHGWMSGRLMVLSFTGRKSGKKYSIPVGYVRQGEEVFVFTQSSWRKNFLEDAPVSLRLQGKDYQGTARLATDPARIKQIIQVLAASNGEQMARRMGFWVENLETASPEEVQQAVKGTYFIAIHLNPTQE